MAKSTIVLSRLLVQLIGAGQYLDIVKDIMTKVAEHRDDDVPESIKDRDVAKAFYGIALRVIKKSIQDENDAKDMSASIAVGMDDIIQKNVIVDWQLKDDVHNRILNALEDYLTDSVSIKFDYDDIDIIMEEVLKIAKIRYAQ